MSRQGNSSGAREDGAVAVSGPRPTAVPAACAVPFGRCARVPARFELGDLTLRREAAAGADRAVRFRIDLSCVCAAVRHLRFRQLKKSHWRSSKILGFVMRVGSSTLLAGTSIRKGPQVSGPFLFGLHGLQMGYM